MRTLIWNLTLKTHKKHRVVCHCHHSISKSPYPRTLTALLNSTKSHPRNQSDLSTINQLCPPNPNSTSFVTSENAPRTDAPQVYLQNNTKHIRWYPSPATEWSYLKTPNISERLNHRITDIFRKENIPVRTAHKSYTLRQALSHCTRDKCPISNTGLCLRRNVVYQLTCNSCDQQYIGSTTRFTPARPRKRTFILLG